MTDTYTIAIVTAAGDTVARAGVRIDGAGPSLAEVRAAAGGNEIPGELADVDFGLIVRTVRLLTGTAPAVVPPANAAGEPNRPDRPSRTPARPAPGVRATAAESPRIDPVTAPASAPEVPAAVDITAAETPRADSKPVRERTRPGVASTPSDFGVHYRRSGSIAKVARHYDVPVHTARAWIASLGQHARLGLGKQLIPTVAAQVSAERVPDDPGLFEFADLGSPGASALHCPTCGTKPSGRYGPIQLAADVEFRWLELDTASNNAGGLVATRHCAVCQPDERFAVECADPSCDNGPILGGRLAGAARDSNGRLPAVVAKLLIRRGWSAKSGASNSVTCPRHSDRPRTVEES